MVFLGSTKAIQLIHLSRLQTISTSNRRKRATEQPRAYRWKWFSQHRPASTPPAAPVSHRKHSVPLVFSVTFFRAAQQRIAESEHQSHLHGRCVDWERLEAYRSGNSWTCGYIESRCSLECPPHGKADCAFTSTVIGDLAAKRLLNQSEEKKRKKQKHNAPVESCGINTLWAATSVQLPSAVLCCWPSQSFAEDLFQYIMHETGSILCCVFTVIKPNKRNAIWCVSARQVIYTANRANESWVTSMAYYSSSQQSNLADSGQVYDLVLVSEWTLVFLYTEKVEAINKELSLRSFKKGFLKTQSFLWIHWKVVKWLHFFSGVPQGCVLGLLYIYTTRRRFGHTFSCSFLHNFLHWR